MTDRYARHYGDQFNKDLSVKEIAATIRKKLRAAAKDDATPLAGFNVSVRYRTASMMQAIDVELSAPAGLEVRHTWKTPGQTWADETNADTVCETCGIQAIAARNRNSWWLTEAGFAAKTYAEKTHNAYNYDGSDSMTDYFDVNYYGQVNVIGEKDYNWKG